MSERRESIAENRRASVAGHHRRASVGGSRRASLRDRRWSLRRGSLRDGSPSELIQTSSTSIGNNPDSNGLIGGRFRIRANSLYEPPPQLPTTDTGRKSLTFRRTFGSAGIAGPLIAFSKFFVEHESVQAIPTIESESGETPELTEYKPRRKIGLLGCICVIIGCVLGSGIFAAPQQILIVTRNPGLTLIVWFTYGVIALVASLCYVELGCTIPVSGGDYAYLNECFGELFGFLFQWAANLIIIPTVCAIMGSVVAKNLITPHIPDGDAASIAWATRLLAIMFIMLFCYINSVSAELTEKLQGWLMIINVVTIALLISCGIAKMSKDGLEPSANFVPELPTPPNNNELTFLYQLKSIVKALYLASFSYFGYQYVNYITEDLENPMRNLPIGICISIPLIIFLNVFVNFCYMASIPNDVIMNTETVASEMLATVLKGSVNDKHIPYILWIAPTLVAIAVLGGLTSNILTCSRVAYIGARNRHFPGMFALTHHVHNTPIISIILIGIMASLFVLTNNIPFLIGILTYLVSAINCICIFGLIHLRIRKPELPRPIKLPLAVPICYSILATFMFFAPIVTINGDNWKSEVPAIAGAIAVVLSGIPVYYIFVRRERQWIWISNAHSKVMRFLQKLLLVLQDDEFLDDDPQRKLQEIDEMDEIEIDDKEEETK